MVWSRPRKCRYAYRPIPSHFQPWTGDGYTAGKYSAILKKIRRGGGDCWISSIPPEVLLLQVQSLSVRCSLEADKKLFTSVSSSIFYEVYLMTHKVFDTRYLMICAHQLLRPDYIGTGDSHNFTSSQSLFIPLPVVGLMVIVRVSYGYGYTRVSGWVDQ